MRYNFDQIIPRENSNSVKWEHMHTHNPRVNRDTLPFWIADMDFACPPAMIRAIKKRADMLIMGYSKVDSGYHESVCNWMKRRFSWQIQPETIFISPGVVPAIKNLLLCLTRPGDGVIIQQPVYYPFSALIALTDRKIINNALINDQGHYFLNIPQLKKQASQPRTTMMLLCSPHNPVGRVWTKEELEQIGRICLENNVILVADEIHFDLLRTGFSHIPMASLFPQHDTIITCTSPSKSFNCAGLQTSNIIIDNQDFQRRWQTQVGPEHPSPLGLAAAQAAYDHCEDWLIQLCSYLDDNFHFMKQYLDQHLPKTGFRIPEGTYLAWLDFRAWKYSAGQLDRILLEKGNVLLDGGAMFGPEGNGFQRMNIACPRSILQQGLQRIVHALKK